MIPATCVSTVRSVRNSRRADPAVGAALGHERQHLPLPGRELGQRVGPPLVPDQLRDDLGVERRATPRDPAQRIEELVHVEHAVLEQVAEPARGDQVDRVARVSMCWESSMIPSPGWSARRSRAARAPSAPRCGGMWMSTTARSGRVLCTAAVQRLGVARRGDDLVARVGEQPRQTLAEQAESSAITMRTAAPPRPRCRAPSSTESRPPRGRDPVDAARRGPNPAGRAPPRPSSLIRTWTCAALACHRHRHGLGVRVLDDVGHRLARDVVGGGGDVVGHLLLVQLEHHRDRQRRGERPERGAEPGVEVELGAGPWAMRAQLGDRGAELGDGLVEQPVHVEAAVAEVALREPDRHAERDEPLLGAVVQVALQPSALPVARVQDPRAAVGHLAQRLGELQPRAGSARRSARRRTRSPAAAPARPRCAPAGAYRRCVADVHRHLPPVADRQRRRVRSTRPGLPGST